MQLGLIFYFWILLRSFRLFPLLISLCSRRKQPRKAPAPEEQTQRSFNLKLCHYFTQHDRITRVILVEFQEAQCFFMMASQTAILLAKSSTTIFESYTMPALRASNGIAGMVSSAGVLPIVMGMWSLHKMHLTEPWIFFLSVATVILSEFTLYWTYEAPLVDQLSPFDYNGWSQSCGGYAPPLIYCVDQTEAYDLRVPVVFFWQVLNPYCLVVFGLDVILWLRPYVVKIVDIKGIRGMTLTQLGLGNSSRKGQRIPASAWTKGIEIFPSLLTFCVESLFIAAVFLECLCFAEFLHIQVIDFSNWGFGQIVAMTIWFPVVSKYAYLVLCESHSVPDCQAEIPDYFVVGTQSYSQARMPESDPTDNKEENPNQDVDIESAVLKSSDGTEHKVKVSMEGVSDEVN